MSNTRWSARTESVKPFAEKINEIKNVIDSVLELNLTSETRSDLNGIKKYMESFECLVLGKNMAQSSCSYKLQKYCFTSSQCIN